MSDEAGSEKSVDVVRPSDEMDSSIDTSTSKITRLPSPTSSFFPRAASPVTDIFPRRLGKDEEPIQRGMKLGKNPHLIDSRISSHSKSNDKGKEPVRNFDISTSNFGREHYAPHYNGSSPYGSRPTADNNVTPRNKFRGSLLVAASDALGFKFGRRRTSLKQQLPLPNILTDVIEISATRVDEEVEERNRLREMAAQAIGLGPFIISQDNQLRDDSTTEEDEDHLRAHETQSKRLGLARTSEATPTIGGRSPHESTLSVTIPFQQKNASNGRFRSSSIVSHSRSNSMTIAPIPPYPLTVSSLTSFLHSAGTFPKYYPPSSLRIFALSRNWKNRYLILSSPATLVTRGQGPAVSYLHLFKSSNRDEKELERLEINEESVVFVAEDEVGGRKNVIKVGGVDVGAMKKEYTHEEGGHAMWLLQIVDQAESQKWITNIKNAILGQRTVRAGLIPAHTLGNNEPRGDMDVMLSIRAQGLVTSSIGAFSPSSQSISLVDVHQGDKNPNYASSVSSQSVGSQPISPKPIPGAVSTLKGLFNNSVRPRSASRAASVDAEKQQERGVNEDSFVGMSKNMLRSSTPETQFMTTVSSATVLRTNLPLTGPVGPLDRRIDNDRTITSERQPVQWVNTESTFSNKDRSNKALSMVAASLQPPPRKRWTSVGPSVYANSELLADKQAEDDDRHNSISTSVAPFEGLDTEAPSSPNHLQNFQFGTPEQRPRAPSLRSVSTFASADNPVNVERSSSSTKRSSGTKSTRRWSRQGMLPNRTSPPTDPPPAIPTQPRRSSDRVPSPIPSQNSQQSVVSNLPTFTNTKRASGSSVHSNNSLGVPQGASASNHHTGPTVIRIPATHRISVPPPPRPAPTSALPPAPIASNQDTYKSVEQIPNAKSSFRNSVAHRAFRLSMVAAPNPPPSSTLPPRPDEPTFKNHRRRHSGGNNIVHPHATKLETIPASPIPVPLVVNPFPPPLRPLPPTPHFNHSDHVTTIQASAPTKRSTSIKQRLRILSTPVSVSQPITKQDLSRHHMILPTPSRTSLAMAPPATPIAERITMFQNDPSFLQIHTPTLPALPLPQSLLPHPQEEIAEITSLSPPPRRGSKQLLETELLNSKNVLVLPDDKLPTVDERRYFSLSRPGSPTSNGSHHSHQFLELDWEHPEEEIRDDLVEEKLASAKEPRHLSL